MIVPEPEIPPPLKSTEDEEEIAAEDGSAPEPHSPEPPTPNTNECHGPARFTPVNCHQARAMLPRRR